MNLLFVCSGNICRSPYAAAIMRHKVATFAVPSSSLGGLDIQIKSAGTSASNELPMSFAMETILAEGNIDATHRSQRITWELVDWADLILTMTQAQKFLLMAQVPELAPKLATLKEYVGDTDAPDIDDPFGTDLESYRKCTAEIEAACDRLLIRFHPPT